MPPADGMDKVWCFKRNDAFDAANAIMLKGKCNCTGWCPFVCCFKCNDAFDAVHLIMREANGNVQAGANISEVDDERLIGCMVATSMAV